MRGCLPACLRHKQPHGPSSIHIVLLDMNNMHVIPKTTNQFQVHLVRWKTRNSTVPISGGVEVLAKIIRRHTHRYIWGRSISNSCRSEVFVSISSVSSTSNHHDGNESCWLSDIFDAKFSIQTLSHSSFNDVELSAECQKILSSYRLACQLIHEEQKFPAILSGWVFVFTSHRKLNIKVPELFTETSYRAYTRTPYISEYLLYAIPLYAHKRCVHLTVQQAIQNFSRRKLRIIEGWELKVGVRSVPVSSNATALIVYTDTLYFKNGIFLLLLFICILNCF